MTLLALKYRRNTPPPPNPSVPKCKKCHRIFRTSMGRGQAHEQQSARSVTRCVDTAVPPVTRADCHYLCPRPRTQATWRRPCLSTRVRPWRSMLTQVAALLSARVSGARRRGAAAASFPGARCACSCVIMRIPVLLLLPLRRRGTLWARERWSGAGEGWERRLERPLFGALSARQALHTLSSGLPS